MNDQKAAMKNKTDSYPTFRDPNGGKVLRRKTAAIQQDFRGKV